MNIGVQNLGIIKRAEISSDYPLILLCGPNSTGKTYLSNLITSLFSNNYRIITDDFQEIADSIIHNGQFNLKKEYLDNFLLEEGKFLKASLKTIYGISGEISQKLFRYLNLNLQISDESFSHLLSHALEIQLMLNKHKIILHKGRNTESVEITIDGEKQTSGFKKLPLWEYIIYYFLKRCAHSPVLNARMLTVERNSIYTFNTELSLSRNELIDTILDYTEKDSRKLNDIIERRANRYPLAINESLRVANDLENIQKKESEYYEFAKEIESKLLHGTININKTGSVEFVISPAGKKNKRLPIHLTSSIVKTLSSLIIYLKHIAAKGDLLVIDEPEMNLHPESQRILTRIFATMVNKGLRLMISTHSDFIIREFNNLVMAYELHKSDKLPEELSSYYEKSEYLNKKDLEIVNFSFNKKGQVETKRVDVDEFGFNVQTIDDTIDSQNDVSEALYETLRYGESDE